MIIKNLYQAPKEWVVAHEGHGKILFHRPFSTEDFQTDLSFVDYVEIPPGCSIGEHLHGDNEELYFIIDGKGSMTVNDEAMEVSAGDLIVNKRGWKHGLTNESDRELKVLVWEVAYTG